MIERMVLFGASGDLTSRLVMPALAQLAEAGLLPRRFTIVGSSVTDWSDDEFCQHIADGLKRYSRVAPSSHDTVLRNLSFRSADVTRAEDVRAVVGEEHPPTLVYLALPPGLFEPVLHTLAKVGLRAYDAVAIEKPFGTDLGSAQRLNDIIRVELPEPTIFRIDHFLTSELVRRIMALRFLNRVFEPTLNNMHVERVEISWLESLTLENRASYYDTAGALKDMVQNHLIEAMALMLMEQPARLDQHSLGGNRVEALRGVATPSPQRIKESAIRARYTAGTIGLQHVPAYIDEPGVDRARNTETYTSLTLEVDSPRWTGVEFTLHAGKALPTDSAEIAVHYRSLPPYLLAQWPGVEPNVLGIGLNHPYVRLATAITSPERPAEMHELNLQATPPRRTPYANLFLEMLRANPTLFIRGDEAEEAWRIVDPVVTACSLDQVPMGEYPAGTLPPGTSLGRRVTEACSERPDNS